MKTMTRALALGVAALGAAGSWTLAAPVSAASNRLVMPPSVRLLIPHNQERAAWRVPPLTWDPALAAAADRYAVELARTERWGHSNRAARPDQGENLWMGTRGAFTPEQMVAGWLSERRLYRPGIFPNVTRSRNWTDVGHYSQVIWRGTTRVGCAIRSSRRDDYLVCRYSPAGNVDGRPVA
jgi:hypothetical protein